MPVMSKYFAVSDPDHTPATAIAKMSSPTIDTDPFDVDNQIKKLRLTKARRPSRKTDGVHYAAFLNDGGDIGNVPVVIVHDCALALCGKKDEKVRGFKKVLYNVDGEEKSFYTLNVAFGSKTQPELQQLCKGMIDHYVTRYDPVSKSMLYQNELFPEKLTDGSKVFSATQAIVSREGLKTVDFDGTNHWDSPANTYGSFLYGDDEENHTWYTQLTINTGFMEKKGKGGSYLLLCVDENDRPLSKKTESGKCVYSKDGVPLGDSTRMDAFVESDLFKMNRWRVTTAVQPHSMTIHCRDDINGNPVVFPSFQMRTHGIIKMQLVVVDDIDHSLALQQRDELIANAVMGTTPLPRVSRKRAAVGTFNNPVKKKPIVEVTDGNETEALSQIDGEE